MAATEIALKSNVFLTLDDVKDWLKIKLDNTENDNRLRRMMNMATDLCEKYVDGPIKSREYVETRDGDSSNVIVPDYYPVQSIQEIRIDYTRTFDSTTIIEPEAYLLRGFKNISSIGIKGTDVVVRDDDQVAILGRIFLGAVVGSIKLTYTAGWGATAADIPFDLQQAVLLTVEYFYMVRENRELNVKSKNNNSQGYSRDSGLPLEVEQLLDRYKDFTLGRFNQPQKNTFVV